MKSSFDIDPMAQSFINRRELLTAGSLLATAGIFSQAAIAGGLMRWWFLTLITTMNAQ